MGWHDHDRHDTVYDIDQLTRRGGGSRQGDPWSLSAEVSVNLCIQGQVQGTCESVES